MIDADAGGTGNFANEPSPETIAFFLNTNDPIDFSVPVGFVEIHYVASSISLPVRMSAYPFPGCNGGEIAFALGNTVGTSFNGAPCVGDPSGSFCLFDTMTIDTSPAPPGISSICIAGAVANQFGFDDMTFCESQPGGGGDCDLGPIEAKLDMLERKADDQKAEIQDIKAEIGAIAGSFCDLMRLLHTPNGQRAGTCNGVPYTWNCVNTGGPKPCI